jgi:butyryl-CoA dehydrogenase
MLPPRHDLDFLLHDWLRMSELAAHPRFAHVDRDTADAMLGAAIELAEQAYLPHAAKSDANPPTLVDGRVQLIPEIGQALAAYREAGFFGMEAPLEECGLGLPCVLASAMGGVFSAANVATNGYAFLTQAAANLIRHAASDEQRARWLPKMLAGEWFGTMCLSEPQAGSSVGDIRTIAEPRPDGTYAIKGNKMWISSGDHELAENIVHLVLAKIPGGPAGTKGISLFIVPRKRVGADGAITGDNGVTLVGLNHKLGTHGQVNCLLDFGGAGECIGELVGAPHEGMRHMFLMMNEARIGVGLGAAMSGYAGYRAALAYARERRQGRRPGERDASSPMVPIIEHVDVRRMLLASKAYVEGSLALCLYAAKLIDEARVGDDAARAEAQALVDLLTPVVKAWPSDYALAANDLAIQIHGGAGYTRDFPVERLWRENRINAIHEGTNGIQALDLLGRKLLGDQGRALGLLAARIQASLAACADDAELAPLAAELGAWLPRIGDAVARAGALAKTDPELAFGNAYALLDAFGHVVVGWQWLEQARVAGALLAGPDRGGPRADFLRGKRQAARWFITWALPTKRAPLALFAAGDATCRDATDAMF